MTLFPVARKLFRGKSGAAPGANFPLNLLRSLIISLMFLNLPSLVDAAGSAPTSGLVGYWSFDDGTASDSSGKGNHGNLVGNPTVAPGSAGQALSLNGLTQYVNLRDVLDPAWDDLSIFAWVKTTQAGGFNMIISKRNSSDITNSGYQLFQNGSGALSFTFGDGNAARVRVDSVAPRINDGNWHLVGVAFNRAANGIIYVDGQPATNGSGSIRDQSGPIDNRVPLRFGVEDQTNQGFYWGGSIDEVRMYNRVLSSQEVSDMYSSPSPASFDFSLTNFGDISITGGSSIVSSVVATLVSSTSQQIRFTVTGLPTSATGSFSQINCTPNCSSQLTLNASSTTPAGSFPITVTATGGGISRSTSFKLNVVQPVVATTPPAVSTGPTVLTTPASTTNTQTVDSVSMAATAAASSTNSLTAFKTLSPITLDGNLDESVWGQASFVTFSNPLRSDNAVKVSVLWDDANLYFAYDVRDDQIETSNGGSLSLDDGAEIYIDAQNTKSIVRDSNDYSFFANINNVTKPTAVTAKTLTKAGGYTMEIKIPWSALSVVPSAGRLLGLLLANNDRDFGKSFQFDWLGLINTGSYDRPNLWGTVTLSGTSVSSQGFEFSVANAGDKSVTAGSSITNTISASLVSGGSQQISFSAAGLPSGATGSFSQLTCNLNCSSVLTVSTAAGTSGGTFPITVTATGGGVTKTTAFLLTVALSVANGSSTVSAQTVHSPITATLLGQTGEDVVGTRAAHADGVADVHIRLSGVSGTISSLRVTGLDGIWEMPLNTKGNWLVAAVPTSDPSLVDVFINYFKPISSYTLAITYSDGQTQTVSTVPAPTHGPLTATLLGQTGEDVVGTRSHGRDGVPDVHVLLSGVSGTISKLKIAGLDGIWEMPLNAQGNWLVNAVPTSDPSVFDVFFNYFKSISTYTLTLTYTDGQSQTMNTTAAVSSTPPVTAIVAPVVPVSFDFSLSNGGDKALNPGSSATNTVTANLVSGTAQQIAFSIAGLPSGSLASFSTGSCSPNCSTSVSISSAASTAAGNYPITVTAAAGGVSKSSSFTLSVIAASSAPGQTYYVSSGVGSGAQAAGNDSNPGTLSQPFKTLQKAIPLLKPGYTLIVRGGEYDTVNGLANGANSIIPSGTSWSNPVTIQAYPGERPVFRRFLPAGFGFTEAQLQGGNSSATAHNPTLAECQHTPGFNGNFPWGCWGNDQTPGYLKIQGVWMTGYVLQMWNDASNPVQYIIFDGINFDARGIIDGLITLYDGAQHLRFQNLEIRNGIFSCVTNPGGKESLSVDHQWINVKIHHCGAPYDTNVVNGILAREHPASRFYQTWYMHSSGILWDGIESYKNSGAGVSPLGRAGDYLAGGNTIRNSYFHDNTEMSLICAGGWLVENNVIVSSVEGITTYGCTIRNNTFVASGSSFGGIYLYNYNSGTDVIENNIIIGYDSGISSDQVGGPSPIARNNLILSNKVGKEIYATSVRITQQNNIFGKDPKFVNPASGDYRLQAGSPAIGKATDGGDIGAR